MGSLVVLIVVVFFAVVFIAPMVERYKTLPPQPSWVQQLQHMMPAIPGVSQPDTGSKSTARSSGAPTGNASHLSSPGGACFDLARAAARKEGIDPTLYARQINQESGCQSALCSSAGACGAAQLMPEMATSLNVDPYNVQQSLQAGAHLMAGYLRMYSGSWPLALACYNAGTGRVKQVLAAYGANWYAHLPPETQHYITAILGNGGQA